MISLNNYLYNGDSVLNIIHHYADDLRADALVTHSQPDLVHANFLLQMTDLLENNGFLTSQSQRLQALYSLIAREYPFLSFIFKGRIKSLIRSEEKFNGRLVESVRDFYARYHMFPIFSEVRNDLLFRDLIAYRFVISLPGSHPDGPAAKREKELSYLYELADRIPRFLEEHGFTLETASEKLSSRLTEEARPYYKDYVEHPTASGYRSLHITVYDSLSRSHFELQLRTKEMDDLAEIGDANHYRYEKRQEASRSLNADLPREECFWYDEAYERVLALQNLELKEVKVDMFTAINNILMNDCCGLYRGRLITPFEHLARL